MKVSAIIPSTGRPQQLIRCVKQLIYTAPDIEVVCIIEHDIRSYRELAREGLPIKIHHRLEHKGPVYGWNEGAAMATGDAFVLCGDDLWFTEGWLDESLDALEKIGGYGLVGFNDLHNANNPKVTWWDHYLVTRDYCMDSWGGVFVVPHYHHYCLDIEACHHAQDDGVGVYAEKAIVEHRHHRHGAAKRDKTYDLGRAYHKIDAEIYASRKKAGWPIDYGPILKGRAQNDG